MSGMERMQRMLRIYQAGAGFFAGPGEAWDRPEFRRDFSEMNREEFVLEYDFLFRGADADVEMILWASGCSGRGNILWDGTTLEVIKTYHSWGYRPVKMEGNPPDYLGEMFRFLAYLTSAGIHCLRQGEDPAGPLAAAEAFIRNYVFNTAVTVAGCIRACRKDSPFLAVVERLARALEVAGGVEAGDLERSDAGSDPASFADPAFSPIFPEVIRRGPNPPIPLEEERTVNTAGINNCGGCCVIRAVVREGCLLRIETDPPGNSPQLRACVRGRGYRNTFLSGSRLKYPMKRIGERGGGKFARISWQEAADLAAGQWKRIKETYGVGSRYVNYATGVTGIMRPGRLAMRLLALDGGYLGYYNSYSSACANYVTPYLYGTAFSGNSPADLLNTKFLILWGHNPAETIFGPELNGYLGQLKRKGVPIAVIDPRLSNTAAAFADCWIPIRPSTDSALADGMAYVILSEGLEDRAFMDRYCLGFDEEHMPEGVPAGESYTSYLFGKKDGIHRTPEWAERITGVPAQTIRSLARQYAAAKPACLLPGLGAQRTGNGEQVVRGQIMLACLTGNVGRPGGGAAGSGWIREHGGIGLFNQPANPYPGQIPVFQWARAVERGTEFDREHDGLTGVSRLESNIKMILNLAGNTLVNQHSDINQTTRLLRDETKCEFILCSDLFMTPSARYADLLLPATSVFEGNNIVNPWIGGGYLLRNNQVIEPLFGCRFEWEWLKEVADRLGYYREFVDGKEETESWLRENYEILRRREPELPDYETFSNAGGWRYRDGRVRVAFREQIADPENHPFPTRSGKIEIVSPDLYRLGRPEEIPAIPRHMPCPEGPEDPLTQRYPLQLVGWHTRRRCHSIHDNNQWMDEVEAPALWIHPEDAGARGIGQGDLVEVFNDRGSVRIPALVTERIMRGVTAMSQGGWYRPDGQGRDTRGSINVLTDGDHPSPLAKGNPQHTNLVEVKRAGI